MAGFFTKLDAGITDSTIWHQPDHTRLTWITMLAMADQHGYVGASIPGLASRARVPIDACVAALECFKAPDEYSRTKDHDGRRIAEADGGWILLNHAKYRAAQSADDRRERSRIAMAALRARRKAEKAEKATDANGEQTLTMLAQAEADNRSRQQKEYKTHTEDVSREEGHAGRVCRELREAGITDVNPGHPTLLALLEAGASDAEIVGAAASCVSRGKGFAYLLGMVKKQRAEAAVGMVRGALPPAETTHARMMRERMEKIAPAVAAKRPGPVNVIDMEVVNVSAKRLG